MSESRPMTSILFPKQPAPFEVVDSEAREGVRQLTEEMASKDKPLVYIDGEIPTTKDNVLATMTVKSKWLNIFAYIKIKCQGSSSMSWDKKNFTVALYEDEARKTPLYITIPGWKHASNKFVFKANYIDHLHARNIVTARIWSEIVTSRHDYDTLPAELRNSPNNGAVDGFPIIVYTNGNYQGLYTWNIGKDPWMWGMDEDNADHVLMCAEINNDGKYVETPCNFRALWSGVDKEYWEIEVGENSDALKNSVNALISCVKDTSDADFHARIVNHLDVQSAIDYYLLCLADNGVDGLGKNTIIGKYTPYKWIFGAYDKDTTWGLYWDGKGFYAPDERKFPQNYHENIPLLLARLMSVYKDRMVERARELRKGPLSYANIVSHFERFVNDIGKDAYADDLIPYPNIPSADVNNIWQIREFVRERLKYYDAWVDELEASVPCESLTVEPELVFDTTDAQSINLTMLPGNTTDKPRVFVSNRNVISYENGVVTPVSNGVATIDIVCGSRTAHCMVTVKEYSVADNLWNISDRTMVKTSRDTAAANPAPVDFNYDSYYGFATRTGIWSSAEDMAGVEIDGEDVSLKALSRNPATGNYRLGYGIVVPIQLTAGETYSISYNLTNYGIVSLMYYNEDKVFQKFTAFNNEGNKGTNTYANEFVAEDYAYAAISLIPSEPQSTEDGKSIYTDIAIEKVS